MNFRVQFWEKKITVTYKHQVKQQKYLQKIFSFSSGFMFQLFSPAERLLFDFEIVLADVLHTFTRNLDNRNLIRSWKQLTYTTTTFDLILNLFFTFYCKDQIFKHCKNVSRMWQMLEIFASEKQLSKKCVKIQSKWTAWLKEKSLITILNLSHIISEHNKKQNHTHLHFIVKSNRNAEIHKVLKKIIVYGRYGVCSFCVLVRVEMLWYFLHLKYLI